MVYKREYSYRNGFTPCVDAQTVGAVMEEIESRDGEVTKEAFLEASRPAKSPTHDLFEWNDKKAAEKYRLDTARRTINHIQVKVYSEETDEESILPAFVNVKVVSEGSYVNVIDAMTNQQTRKSIVARVTKEFKAIADRNRKFTEFSKVIAAIDELEV